LLHFLYNIFFEIMHFDTETPKAKQGTFYHIFFTVKFTLFLDNLIFPIILNRCPLISTFHIILLLIYIKFKSLKKISYSTAYSIPKLVPHLNTSLNISNIL
jgi:hypothetical protein